METGTGGTMNWLKRIYNRWRYRPTLQDFWRPSPGEKIVSTTQFQDVVIVATEYGVYVITPGQRVLWDWEIQKIAVQARS
jgi:hypothetical protein